jgi:ABC-type transport system substrate-binding protein
MQRRGPLESLQLGGGLWSLPPMFDDGRLARATDPLPRHLQRRRQRPAFPRRAGPRSRIATAPVQSHARVSGFCDPRLDALIRRASTLEASDPAAAWHLWSAIDRRVTAQSPWIPLISVRWLDVVSKRLRNYAFHPVLGGFMISQARVT